MKLQIYNIDCHIINIKLFAALKLRVDKAALSAFRDKEKRAACGLLFFLKGWN